MFSGPLRRSTPAGPDEPTIPWQVRRNGPGVIKILLTIAALAAAAIAVAATLAFVAASGTASHAAASPAAKAGTPATASLAAISCESFRAAAASAARSLTPAGTVTIPAIQALGTVLTQAAASLHAARPDPDPPLQAALRRAGTIDLAIAHGEMPQGPAAAYNQASSSNLSAAAHCAELGH